MATFTYTLLSGSTDGVPIKVVATSTAGTLIHTAHATAKDEITLYAVNTDATARKLTIEFGGATDPDCHIEMTIPPESGPVLVVPGFPLTNSKTVRAFAATASVVTIAGSVNRVA